MPDPSTLAIIAPAGYVPVTAIAHDNGSGNAQVAQRSHPLPVTPVSSPALSTPLAGTATASGQFGPFVPEAGRTIWVTLSGTWTGTVRLLRSTDGGATRLPLTVAGEPWGVFTAPANEPVTEDATAAAAPYPKDCG